ncbi:MAG: hypothetical protein HY271_20240 [Deltaproteobacteria bacterium]|nr:hypothetical protein [Deltaproteobacteria bacterium]
MELSEEMRYRLCYLTLRLALDHKLERDWGKTDCSGVLEFLDLMSGSHLAQEQSNTPDAERKYVSQQPKLEDFLDAEFGEEVLAVVTRAVTELV